MSDKHATSSAPVDRPSAIRNIALVGHTGAGKTTLVEALLHAAGAIPRMGRVEDGTTASDHDEAEIRQQRSVALSLCSFTYAGVKVNLLDTPGYGDFVGELRAGLRAADGALFVVSAADGIDGATQQLWDECADIGLPRAVVITRLDSPRADFERMVAICQRVLGDKHDASVLPLYLPLESDDGHIGGLIGLLSQRIMDYSGGTRVERDPDDEHIPLIADQRDALIEAIIAESEDETLMDRYLAGEDVDTKVLIDDLETAVARGSFYPVLAAAVPPQVAPDSPPVIGMVELLEVLTSAFPSPLEHEVPAVTRPDGRPHDPLVCDPEGPLVAEVVRTASDPYVGRVSLVRVFSGTLRPDAPVHVSGHTTGHAEHDVDEKVGHLTTGFGKTLHPVSQCVAGDIVLIGRLMRAETGDTLSAKDDPLLIQAWDLPQSLLPIAVEARSKADEDKLAQGLARLVAEDPTVRLERSHETGQQLLWCMGEAHIDVLLERLRQRHGVELDQVPVRVPLRETFGAEASGHGRHVKQSGGHGQFAVVDLTVRPLAAGEGYRFVDKTVGGSVPHQFVPSVDKGIRAQLERGLVAGYPVVDVEVVLTDGKAHSVDSSDMAFQTAAGLALKDAAAHGALVLLEPVLSVAVDVGDGQLGAVMNDLSTRRGRVSGTEPDGAGRTVVHAEVPETELLRYPLELRALSQGTGRFSRDYLRHEPMPPALAGAFRQS
ncbi:elongation factor G-like protein EF-G2 [Acidothermaceae bacterium B102]|nr:elongation factor G-like protein EF-G2 [Acidothermaceae bacterium B102]